MDVSQYLSMFIDESKEHLQAMNENLLSLENNPQDIGFVHHIFRSAHTLKGMSATMGFEDLASLTHEMENVLDLVRNHKLDMDPFIFDCIFKSLDSLETMVGDIVQGGTGKANVTEIVVALKSIVIGDYHKQAEASSKSVTASNNVSGMEVDQYQYSVLQQSIESGHLVFFIEVSLREDCVLKAARAFMIFDVLDLHGEIVKSTPSVQDIEQEKFDRTISVYYISKVDKADLEKEILGVSEIEAANAVQVDNGSLAEMVREASSSVLAAEPVAQMEADKQEVVSDSGLVVLELEAGRKEGTAAAQQKTAPVANRTIRVDIERLDALMNLFSELLIDRGRLEQLASEVRHGALSETVEHMSRVSSDLQNIVLKLRMVPVDSVFNRFPRMIRDVAKTLNKKVDLVISGAETELDRTVIDEIGDPLVHLLRNAVDHGIESIAERVSSGKCETGTVNLRAFHSGNHVFIEVEEDGAGINYEKVLQRALKNGLITLDQAAKITEYDIAQLLFASGFSTAG